MKDHVEIGHFAKYGAFRVNRDKVMDLTSIQASLILIQRPPKPYKLLKFL